jgi:ribose/xylose/arabinose/galactoside ABC-type transport system permease subunit
MSNQSYAGKDSTDRDRLSLDRSRSVRLFIQDDRVKPVLFFLIAIVIAVAMSRDFLKWANIRAVLISAAPLMLLAIGEGLVVLTGMIDLSPESVLASSGTMLATFDIIMRLPFAVSLILTLIYGIVVGTFSGLLIVKARIPSFVVTLGMYWGLRGLAMVVTGGYPISPTTVTPPRQLSFSWIIGDVYGFPIMVIIAIAAGIIFQIYVSRFKRGTEIYAIGGNEAAAKTCGINVDRTKIMVFAISGFLGAISGTIMTAWVNQAYAWTAQGYTLQTVAAVVLGGIVFTGGRGTITGVLLGSIIIAMVSDLIVLIGVSPTYNYIAVAAVLILAGLQIRVRKGGFIK